MEEELKYKDHCVCCGRPIKSNEEYYTKYGNYCPGCSGVAANLTNSQKLYSAGKKRLKELQKKGIV